MGKELHALGRFATIKDELDAFTGLYPSGLGLRRTRIMSQMEVKPRIKPSTPTQMNIHARSETVSIGSMTLTINVPKTNGPNSPKAEKTTLRQCCITDSLGIR